MRCRAPDRRLEPRAIGAHGGRRVVAREMMGESEAHADLRRQFRAVVARPEQEDRRQPHVVRHHGDPLERMRRGEVPRVPQDQLLQPLEKILLRVALLNLVTAQSIGRGLVRSRRTS